MTRNNSQSESAKNNKKTRSKACTTSIPLPYEPTITPPSNITINTNIIAHPAKAHYCSTAHVKLNLKQDSQITQASSSTSTKLHQQNYQSSIRLLKGITVPEYSESPSLCLNDRWIKIPRLENLLGRFQRPPSMLYPSD